MDCNPWALAFCDCVSKKADRVRFELTVDLEAYTGFRDRRFQPLSHLSVRGNAIIAIRGSEGNAAVTA